MKILQSTWFSPVLPPSLRWFVPGNVNPIVGVVLTVNEMGVRKGYLGIGEGIDQKEDEGFIAQYGHKLPRNVWHNRNYFNAGYKKRKIFSDSDCAFDSSLSHKIWIDG